MKEQWTVWGRHGWDRERCGQDRERHGWERGTGKREVWVKEIEVWVREWVRQLWGVGHCVRATKEWQCEGNGLTLQGQGTGQQGMFDCMRHWLHKGESKGLAVGQLGLIAWGQGKRTGCMMASNWLHKGKGGRTSAVGWGISHAREGAPVHEIEESTLWGSRGGHDSVGD